MAAGLAMPLSAACGCRGRVVAQGGQRISNLLKIVAINENPAKLNDLGGILGHIYTVFIAGGGNVDHDVAVDVELRHLLRSHDSNGSAGSRLRRVQGAGNDCRR